MAVLLLFKCHWCVGLVGKMFAATTLFWKNGMEVFYNWKGEIRMLPPNPKDIGWSCVGKENLPWQKLMKNKHHLEREENNDNDNKVK